MYHGQNPYEIILEMASFECTFCGNVDWLFPTSNEQIQKLQCTNCHSWIADMQNQEQIELNIEKFKEEQI